VPAVVVTLGTYLAYQGLAQEVMPTPGGSVPAWLSRLSGSIGSIPGMWLLIIPILFAWWLLTRSRLRRDLFSVGADERTAFSAGVNVARTRMLAYVFAGIIAAIGGIALSGLLESADPSVAPVYTLQSVAAVALGGAALTGGRGGLFGAVCGGATLFLADNLLSLAHVSVDVIQIVYGVILLFAVAANGLAERVRKSRRVAETGVAI
jgi:ribose transport system permease protein